LGWIRGLHGILLARCNLPHVIRDDNDGKVCVGRNAVEIWAYDPDDNIDTVPTFVVGLFVNFDNPILARRLARLAQDIRHLTDNKVEEPIDKAFYYAKFGSVNIAGPGMAIIVGDDLAIFDIVRSALLGEGVSYEEYLERGDIDLILLVEHDYPHVPSVVLEHGYCKDIESEIEHLKAKIDDGECDDYDDDPCFARRMCEYELDGLLRDYELCIYESAEELERKGVIAPIPVKIAAITPEGVYEGCEAFRRFGAWLPEREYAHFQELCGKETIGDPLLLQTGGGRVEEKESESRRISI